MIASTGLAGAMALVRAVLLIFAIASAILVAGVYAARAVWTRRRPRLLDLPFLFLVWLVLNVLFVVIAF